jgi:hypothetical protein
MDEVEVTHRKEYRQSIYLEILKLIPTWLKEATSTVVDFVAAVLTVGHCSRIIGQNIEKSRLSQRTDLGGRRTIRIPPCVENSLRSM